MTAVRYIQHQPYLFEAAGLEPVFVADMPGDRPASYQPHTGHALLAARLRPMRGGAEMATVRLQDGRVMDVLACHLRPIEGLARRRILPAPAAQRRQA